VLRGQVTFVVRPRRTCNWASAHKKLRRPITRVPLATPSCLSPVSQTTTCLAILLITDWSAPLAMHG
jgi:hypothetical protein